MQANDLYSARISPIHGVLQPWWPYSIQDTRTVNALHRCTFPSH